MPQISVIIPVIVAGLVVGSLIKSKSGAISNKRSVLASLAAGLFNGLYMYMVYSISPQPTFARGNFTVPSTSWVVLVVESILSGFLIVFAILGIAKVYARIRKGEEAEEPPDLTSEQESKPTSG
jgi:uncharacterized membrane protein YozB (DUF420 family)